MRTLTSAMTLQKNTLIQGSAWVWLFDIDTDGTTILRYTSNSRGLTYNGNPYLPRPIRIESGVKTAADGDMESIKIAIDNTDRVIAAQLELGNIINRTVLARVVNTDLIGTAANNVPLRLHVITAGADNQNCVLMAGMHDLRRVKIPRSVYSRIYCRFFYGDQDCQDGGAGPCDKRPATCRNTWNNYERIGCFPAMPYVHR